MGGVGESSDKEFRSDGSVDDPRPDDAISGGGMVSGAVGEWKFGGTGGR